MHTRYYTHTHTFTHPESGNQIHTPTHTYYHTPTHTLFGNQMHIRHTHEYVRYYHTHQIYRLYSHTHILPHTRYITICNTTDYHILTQLQIISPESKFSHYSILTIWHSQPTPKKLYYVRIWQKNQIHPLYIISNFFRYLTSDHYLLPNSLISTHQIAHSITIPLKYIPLDKRFRPLKSAYERDAKKSQIGQNWPPKHTYYHTQTNNLYRIRMHIRNTHEYVRYYPTHQNCIKHKFIQILYFFRKTRIIQNLSHSIDSIDLNFTKPKKTWILLFIQKK